ncbi:AMP-binding enzyme [Actinacidiphila alni]|uniref:AMP-binding enzyme n=1 Tax=Actinacidiphila alni TaxID=380248 RepID=A0A1I2G815_9ACTN|nr:AMP-binding enzyme [Actinacidiphila alni]
MCAECTSHVSGTDGAGASAGNVFGGAADRTGAGAPRPLPAGAADLFRAPVRGVRTVRGSGSVRRRPAVPAGAAMTGEGRDGPGGPGGIGGGGGLGGGNGGGVRRLGDAGRLPGELLRRRADRSPQTVPALPYPSAAVSGTAGCSFGELDRRARAVAARLGSLLAPGARVLLAYPQGPDLAGAFFGCLYAGMAAVPLVLPGPGGTEAVARAVRRCHPQLVLTGSDGWSPLAVDRTRTQVMEADGVRVAGEPVWRLAEHWRPVGVMRGAPAYHRYYDDGMAGGRMEPAMAHGDLTEVMGELAQAVRLGTDEENVGWIAAVHGVEDAIWRILLPVRITE